MNKTYGRIDIVFSSICWVTAVSFTAYCLYIFSKDEDLCTVRYIKYYETEKDVFPALSLCFKNPFVKNKLDTNTGGVNETFFLHFLQGKYFAPFLANIQYENVTTDISKYLVDYWIQWRDGTIVQRQYENGTNNTFETSYVGFWSGNFYQCSSMPVPQNKEIQTFFVLMNNRVFKSTTVTGDYRFLTFIHYPNQLLRSSQFVKMDWPNRTTDANFAMRFKINSVEVLRRRNKANEPCNENWKNYDDNLLVKHTEAAGCKAPYQRPSVDIKPCISKTEMKKALFQIRADDYGQVPPCRSMEKVLYTYEQHTFGEESKWKGFGQFWVGVYFGKGFKEIKEVR